MKKMSDVFNLPLMADSDNDIAVGNGDWILINPSAPEHVGAHVAHAINHVDALAEALELLLGDKAMIHVSNEKHLQAKAALADYRGEV